MAFQQRGSQNRRHAMKKYICILCCGLLVSPVAYAETPPSLFFTAEEVQTIEALKAAQPISVDESGDVHLGAVFYYAPDDWVLWLQGKRWTPDTQDESLRVIDVQPDEVCLAVAFLPGASSQEIRLKPHQTYRLSSGEVVEGPAALAR